MAAAEKRTDGGQGPSGRPGISARPDLISNQPDAVLGTIVSLLPTKDGCRTQALSRRWRPIWQSTPLNLNAGHGRRALPDRTISDILSGHEGPVRRISIKDIIPLRPRHNPRTFRPDVEQTARDALARTRLEDCLCSTNVLAGLQVLELGYGYGYDDRDVLPPSGFRFAPALRVAWFGQCTLSASVGVDFPRLERLSLYDITLTEETLSTVLAGCPALRSLVLENTVGCDCLRISSPSLRSIGFSTSWDKEDSSIVKVKKLVIRDAPSLERLLSLYPDYGPAIIQVVRAPKLQILGSVSKGTSQLRLGKTVFQKMIAVNMSTTMQTVKILALDHVGPDLDVVLDFLKCFPCVERLYIVLDYASRSSEPNNIKMVRKYVLPNDPIECLNFHLRKVALKVYDGTCLEVGFARFFVMNARVLERMEFGMVNDRSDEWKENHKMKLQLENKASRDARFEFKRFSWSTSMDISTRTHDLSTTDPLNAPFLDGFVTLWQV